MPKLKGFSVFGLLLALFMSTASADPFTPKRIPSDSVPIYVLQIDTGDGLDEFVAVALIGYCGGDPVNRTDPMGTDWYLNTSTRKLEWFFTQDEMPGYIHLGYTPITKEDDDNFDEVMEVLTTPLNHEEALELQGWKRVTDDSETSLIWMPNGKRYLTSPNYMRERNIYSHTFLAEGAKLFREGDEAIGLSIVGGHLLGDVLSGGATSLGERTGIERNLGYISESEYQLKMMFVSAMAGFSFIPGAGRAMGKAVNQLGVRNASTLALRSELKIVNDAGARAYRKWGVNLLKPAKLVKEMSKSDIGKFILDASRKDQIDLVLSPAIKDAGEMGVSRGKQAIAYVRNTQSYKETAKTLIHEGVHSLGVGGSRRAEALARVAELMHAGKKVTPGELRKILQEMKDVKVYDHYPWRKGQTSSVFPGVQY